MKKRTCFALVLILLLLGSFATFLEANAVLLLNPYLFGTIPEESASVWLHTNGTQILNGDNQTVVFNGVSTMVLFGYEPPNYPPTPMTYNPAQMDEVRSHGLNLIRLEIGLSSAVYGIPESQQTPTNLTYHSGFFEYLDSLVNECAKDGLWINLCFVMTSWSPIGGAWSSSDGAGVGFPTWMYDGSWSYFNKTYDGVASGNPTAQGLSDAMRDFWNINDTTAANVRTAYQTFWKDMATHFKDTPNVIFGLWNEPPSSGDTILGGTGQPTQDENAAMYKTFMEQTVDQIQPIDGSSHLIFVNDVNFYLWITNLKVDRPNVVVENHAYQAINPYVDELGNNPTNDTDYFIKLGWRYDQPFMLGEFGGIEEGLQNASGTLSNIQYCNSKGVSWSYLSFRPWGEGWNPSADTWKLLEINLVQGILYYDNNNYVPDVTPTAMAPPTVVPAPMSTATRPPTGVPTSPTPIPSSSQTPLPSDSPTASPEPTITSPLIGAVSCTPDNPRSSCICPVPCERY